MTTTKSLRSIITLSLALAVLLGYGFISAWSAPLNGTVPPANNVPAPIDTSATIQTKMAGGAIGASDLLSTRTTAGQKMMSPLYCNADGSSCLTFDQIFNGLNAAPVCNIDLQILNTPGMCNSAPACPAGYASLGVTVSGSCSSGSDDYENTCIGVICN